MILVVDTADQSCRLCLLLFIYLLLFFLLFNELYVYIYIFIGKIVLFHFYFLNE